MIKLDRQSAKEYGLAVIITLLALLVRFFLDPFLGDHVPYATFFVATAVTTFYAGLGPSLTTVLLGGWVAEYFFVSPRQSFDLDGAVHYVGFATYLMATLTIVGFGQAFRRARERADTVTDGLRGEVFIVLRLKRHCVKASRGSARLPIRLQS
jgi:K+-sensing histidine kinase KdpD